MRFFLPVALLAPVALVAACEPPVDDTGPLDQRAEIPPAPAHGLQVIGPEITIPSGEDQMWCWVPDMEALDADQLVATFETFQGTSGHHLLAMKSIIPRQPGEIFDCTSLENMSTVRPLFTPNTANSEGTFNLLSSEFAVRLPANTQLVMQSHYVNTNLEDIVVRDVGNLVFLEPGEERIEANYFTIHDGDFSVPATNEPYTHSVDCQITQPMQFASIIGHMHEWGTHITVEKLAREESPLSMIYEVADWGPQFRDAPPVTHYPLDQALSLDVGDTLRLTCNWINDTDEPLGFPNEMCDSMLVYYPALPEGFIICGDE